MKLISLTRGAFAIVDDEDFDRLNQFNWQCHFDHKRECFYATRRTQADEVEAGEGSSISMHRMILELSVEEAETIDHVNRMTLDNRKENLRPATNQQNCCNQRSRKRKNSTSKYRGVHLHKNGRWIAQIQCGTGKPNRYLGSYATEEDAAQAYNWGAALYHGEFAQYNVREGQTLQ